jgi:hypothetical protein
MDCARLGLPHGKLPTLEQFLRAYLQTYSPHHPIRLRKDPRLGDKDITGKELWQEIKQAHKEGTQESLEWCRCRLLAMSIEWC